MKRSICFSATLLLSLAAIASAQDDGTCSIARVAGQWGYTFTGTLITPAGAVPMAVVGRGAFDAAGNLSATQTSSVGGKVSLQETVAGTITVNSDCAGTFTVSIYDQSGKLLRTAVWALVFDDNATELRAIATSLALPDGTSLPPIITMTAKKLFPDSGNQQ